MLQAQCGLLIDCPWHRVGGFDGSESVEGVSLTRPTGSMFSFMGIRRLRGIHVPVVALCIIGLPQGSPRVRQAWHWAPLGIAQGLHAGE